MKIIKNYLFRALILTLIIFFNSLKRELFFKIFGLYGLYIIGKSDLIKFYFNTDRPKLIKRFDIKIKIRVYLSESKYYDVFKILFDNYDIINDIELINYYIISSGFMGKCHLRLEIYKIISQYGKSYINVCNLLASSGDMAAKLSCEYIEFAIKNLALIRALSFQYAQNGLYEKYYNISKNLSLLINKKTDYCYLNTNPWCISIGHYRFIDLLIKAFHFGLLDYKFLRFKDNGGLIANDSLHGRYKIALTYFIFPSDRSVKSPESEINMHFIHTKSGILSLYEFVDFIQDNYNTSKSIISVNKKSRDCLREMMYRKLGIPVTSWYVTLHVRSDGFRTDSLGESGSARNVEIEDYRSAILEIVKRGGFVVRCGDASMPNIEYEGLIDYANSPYKTPELDVALIEMASLHIGTNSGLSYIPLVFDVPVIYTNDFPLHAYLGDLNCVVLPKMVWSVNEGRYLNLIELADPNIVGAYGDERVLKRNNYILLNNPPELIRAAVINFLDNMILSSNMKNICIDNFSRRVRIKSKFRKNFHINLSNLIIKFYGNNLLDNC